MLHRYVPFFRVGHNNNYACYFHPSAWEYNSIKIYFFYQNPYQEKQHQVGLSISHMHGWAFDDFDVVGTMDGPPT